MNIVLRKCRYVVKSFKPFHIIENADIVIDENTISCVGECSNVHGYDVLHCENSIALSGFVSSHTHIFTKSWGWQTIEIVEKALKALAIHGFALVHIADNYFDGVCEIANKIGLRVSTGPLIKSYGDLKNLVIAKNLKRDLCIPSINVELSENIDDDTLREIRDFAIENKINLHLILPQNVANILSFYKTRGEWIINHLYKLGLLSKNVCLAHFSWATTWEVEKVAQSEASIAVTPYSDSIKGVYGSVHPKLFELKNISIGIDDIWGRAGTSIIYDVIAMQSVYSTKTWGIYPSIEEVLHYATRGGSQALNIETGIIDIGKLADIVVVKMNKLDLFRDMSKTILNSINTLKYVIVNGKVIWARNSNSILQH